MSELVSRPSVLVGVLAPKAWGSELWLTSTRPEAPARFENASAGHATLAALVAARPEVLGTWARSLYGDTMPVFAKVVATHFPPRVHMGFRRAVAREELLGWLEIEQALLRSWLGALRTLDERSFGELQGHYSEWASRQALEGWRRDDDDVAASLLGPFVQPSLDLPTWLRAVRSNRACFADALNDVDLAGEAGQLLLMGAGVIHAIFGLSHQTHPRDRARPVLQALLATLAERSASGATDAELAHVIASSGLEAARAEKGAPPKNEAWFPTVIDGARVLVEPQQTSDTTYSIADFYTPLVWGADGPRFRKGSSRDGSSREELTRYLADVDLAATSVGALRRAPFLVSGASRPGAELFRLVDEPSRWPFFTAYQLELTTQFSARPPDGVFQQLVVTKGRVELGDENGAVGELSTRSAGFVPGTLQGAYTVTAREPSTVLVFGVPGARGGAPRVV
jgi:hypothetical protein